MSVAQQHPEAGLHLTAELAGTPEGGIRFIAAAGSTMQLG
jgi:hypothetical protein